jgi:hypothetical protein
MVTETFMKMLDLFERGDVDPAARAAFIIEHFDRDIVDKAGLGKLTVKRISRTFDAMRIVFHEIATDLYNTRRGAPQGGPEPAREPPVR